MSSSPKYSDVQVVGDAGRSLAQAIAAASQSALDAWEAGRRRRQELRLEREQAQVRATTQAIRVVLGQLQSEAKAQTIPMPVEILQTRLNQCANAVAGDQSATHAALKSLASIERDLAEARRSLEAVKLGRALDGVAGQLEMIRVEVGQANRRNSERFDPGQFSTIEQSITMIQADLAAKRLGRTEAAVGLLRKQWDTHLQRVRAASEEYERERIEAEHAMAAITDRCNSLAATPGLSRYLQPDLTRLQPDMEALASLYRSDQFANVHQQVQRLSARLDELAVAAQTKIAQGEKQKVVAERLIASVAAARGILISGYPQHAEGKPAVVRFQIVPHGVLHVEISAHGPIAVRAEGFKHEQLVSPTGQLEKTCDGFVEWFEQVRNAARAQGLEIGALRWTGEPTPERARAVRGKKKPSQTIARTRTGGPSR